MSDDHTSTPRTFSRLKQVEEGFFSRDRLRKRKNLIKYGTQAYVRLRNNVTRTRYYFTGGHEHLGDARNVNEEQSPFAFPSCSNMFAYFQFWKTQRRMAIQKRHETSKMSLRPRHDILRRLRVDVEIEKEEAKKHKELKDAIAITDVNPEYFTETIGTAVKEKFSLQRYVDDLREILRGKLLVGEQRDLCIHIEQQFDEERRRLNKIKRQYRTYVDIFEDFLSKDHEKSMKILDEAEKELKLTAMMNEKKSLLSRQYGQVRLDLYFWEENWRLAKTCQMFLFQVSPISWRIENDWIYRSHSGESIHSATTEDIFARFKMAEEVASLECLINIFEEDLIGAGPTKLFFEDPFDLIRVFEAMETQNLNALIHLESLAAPMANMVSTITEAGDKINYEFNEIILAIEELEDSIHKTEERAKNLQEYANYLLQSVFRELVCSEDVLCVYVFIEDAYESCIAPNDAKLNSFTMMKLIEKTHEELNLELDTLPHEVVIKCEREGFKKELKAFKEAQDAARKFELMHQLLDALTRIMRTPIIRKRQPKWRSAPIVERKKEVLTAAEPTEEEWQYLTFFTNYCKHEDFIAYRSKFPDDFDLSFETKHRNLYEVTSDTQLP